MDDALTIKVSHWQKRWKIPNVPWTITGYSRSAYRTGFYIPELGMMLDAGHQNYNKPSVILITHTHTDHISDLPKTLIDCNERLTDAGEVIPVLVYGPADAEKPIVQYITSMFSLNAMTFLACSSINWYKYVGLVPGQLLPQFVTNNATVSLEVFKCDHSIPTISYGIIEYKRKLLPEFAELSGKEIALLRQNGVCITEEVSQKKLAYVCDTSIAVFDLNPGILAYNVVFIECTFLYPDEYQNAKSTKHIHWFDLKPFVVNNPQITFMLFHFSQRYRDQEIDNFFKVEMEMAPGVLQNLNWWTHTSPPVVVPVVP